MDTSALQQLTPTLFVDKEGRAVAPTTTDTNVYDNLTGKTVHDILKELRNNSYTIAKTKVQVITALYDNQTTFGLQYPVVGYDIQKFPIILLKDNDEIAKSNYTIVTNQSSDDQIVLNTEYALKKAGDKMCVIYHYMDNLFQDAVINATTINGWSILFSDPGDVDVPNHVVYIDLLGGWIHVWQDGRKQSLKIGTANVIKHTFVTKAPIMNIDMNQFGYNPKSDTLDIYENGVYIPEDDYYVYDEETHSIHKLNYVLWDATNEEPIHFTILVNKNTKIVEYDSSNPGTAISSIPDNTISEAKLSPELQEKINTIYDYIQAHQ